MKESYFGFILDIDQDWIYIKNRYLKVIAEYVPPCGDDIHEQRSGDVFDIYKIYDENNRDITEIIQRADRMFHNKPFCTLWDMIHEKLES